ncbi:serine protease 53-like [Spea bombifrons]|uniref:serine protease 53-like n=1 Tax=Spea bombifrons TaxID=233779 RepID=UPI00234A63D3|nr:serine protease 53-like [Spea bombifrons]
MERSLVILSVAIVVLGPPGSAADCGKQGLQRRIFGGTNAVPGEWPWHATLSFQGQPQCGGSLISDSWIITAAHCFYGNSSLLDPTMWTVNLGFSKLGDAPESSAANVTASHIRIHEDYTNFLQGEDLALVKLSRPVAFTRFISPVCLPEKTHRFQLRRTCYATGLQDVPRGVPLNSSRPLQKVPQTLIGWRTCNCIYNSHENVQLPDPAQPGMLCAAESDGEKGPCMGDSGGPVVCNEDGVWFLAGVISFSKGCYLQDSPIVITAVSSYQDWIQSEVDTPASFAPQNITVTDDVDNDDCSDLLSTRNPGCGVPQFNVDPNAPGAWPWQVDLQKDGARVCGGTLISNTWVITAAQCLVGTLSSDSPLDWSVIVAPGTPVKREIMVQRISLHGAFVTPEDGKDAALLQLQQPAPLGPFTQPICLPRASHRMAYGSSCWHTGWEGPHRDGNVTPPRAVELELIGPNQCNCIYSHPSAANHSVSILPGMICASYQEPEGNGSRCLSDVGGPLVCQENSTWFLVGLRSFGGQCSEKGNSTLPGVFTQINTYEDWIARVANDAFFNLQKVTPPSELDMESCSQNSSRGCGHPVASPGSAPNNNATERAWPWQVSVQQFGSHACSGALIAETWVLTSAHCMSSVSSTDYIIILGRQSQSGANPHEVTRRVRRVVTHPEYKKTSRLNDLALVEVYYGVTFSDSILPICLPPEDVPPPSTGCWVTGWGNLEPSEISSSSLRELAVSLLDTEKCGGHPNETQANPDKPLCAAQERGGNFTCLKDSSAPLVCQTHPGGPWFLFGIGSSVPTSTGRLCPGNYTSVNSKLSWIREVIPKGDFGRWSVTTGDVGRIDASTTPSTTIENAAETLHTTESPQDFGTRGPPSTALYNSNPTTEGYCPESNALSTAPPPSHLTASSHLLVLNQNANTTGAKLSVVSLASVLWPRFFTQFLVTCLCLWHSL